MSPSRKTAANPPAAAAPDDPPPPPGGGRWVWDAAAGVHRRPEPAPGADSGPTPEPPPEDPPNHPLKPAFKSSRPAAEQED